MRAEEIMRQPAIKVEPTTPLKQAVDQMLRHGTCIVAVVDEDGALRGVLTEMDLLRAQATPGVGEILYSLDRDGAGPGTVASAMTRDVVATEADAEVSDLLRIMVERGLSGIPVVSPRGAVTGIVTRRDILASMARSDVEVHEDVSRLLDEVGEEPFSIEVTEGVVTINRAWMSPQNKRRLRELIKSVPGAMAVAFKE